MLRGRPPKWLIGVGIIALVLGVNAVLAFVNFVTASPTNCLTCHGTGGTPDMSTVSLVHPGYGEVKCVDCHAKPGQFILVEGYRGGFSADPIYVSKECLRCHPGMGSRNDNTGFVANPLAITVSHKAHLDRGAVCTDCHSDIAHDSSPAPTNRPKMEYCYSCHNKATSSCTSCHGSSIPATAASPLPWTLLPVVIGAAPPEIPHDLDGRSSCLVCHQNGVAGSPRVLASHAGRTNDVCLVCHKSASSSTSSGGFPVTTPPKIPHALDGRALCLMCHQDGLVGAPKVLGTHAGRTNEMCQGCHKAPVAPPVTTTPGVPPVTSPTTTAVPTSPPNVPHSLDGRSSCLMCHQDGLAGAPKVPGTHAGRTNDICQACHKVGAGSTVVTTTSVATTPVATVSPSVPPGIPHSLEGRSSCLMCHRDGLAGAPKVLASHLGRTNEMCPLCHRAKG